MIKWLRPGTGPYLGVCVDVADTAAVAEMGQACLRLGLMLGSALPTQGIVVFSCEWQHLPFILADLTAAGVDCQPEEAVRTLLGDCCTPLAIELAKDSPPGIFYDYLAELLG